MCPPGPEGPQDETGEKGEAIPAGSHPQGVFWGALSPFKKAMLVGRMVALSAPPAFLVYKVAHGASWLIGAGLLAGYLGFWRVLRLLRKSGSVGSHPNGSVWGRLSRFEKMAMVGRMVGISALPAILAYRFSRGAGWPECAALFALYIYQLLGTELLTKAESVGNQLQESFWGRLSLFRKAMLVVQVMLGFSFLPGILIYKIAHGANWLVCIALFAGPWIVFTVALLMARFRKPAVTASSLKVVVYIGGLGLGAAMLISLWL